MTDDIGKVAWVSQMKFLISSFLKNEMTKCQISRVRSYIPTVHKSDTPLGPTAHQSDTPLDPTAH